MESYRCLPPALEYASSWLTFDTDELFRGEMDSRVHLAEFSQPLCTAIQIALIDLLRSFGVTPSLVVGHSSGEIAAGLVASLLPSITTR